MGWVDFNIWSKIIIVCIFLYTICFITVGILVINDLLNDLFDSYSSELKKVANESRIKIDIVHDKEK